MNQFQPVALPQSACPEPGRGAIRNPQSAIPRAIRNLRKYLMIAVIDWQGELTYRANSLIWIAWSIFPSITMMLVWLAAYEKRDLVGGITLPQMITYYFFMTLLMIAITPNHEWEVASMIREGKISSYLVRPVDYFWFRAMTESAYQVMKTGMAIPGLLIVAWLFREYIEPPRLPLLNWAGFLASCLLTYMMAMCLKSAIGFTAFWFGEVFGVLEGWNLIMMVFTGRILPITLLPDWLQAVGNVLPFQWLHPFTMRIVQGQARGGDMLFGLGMQLAWCVLLYALVRWVWKRGLVAYEGFGG